MSDESEDIVCENIHCDDYGEPTPHILVGMYREQCVVCGYQIEVNLPDRDYE